MQHADSQPVSPAEWWCRLILQGLAVSFAVVGTTFLFLPDETGRFMNAVGRELGDFSTAPPSAMRFWLSLATGYMVLVTALAYLAQRDLQRNRTMLVLLALGKATSSLTCLGFYLFSRDAFIYLANFLVDGTIALTAIGIWTIVPSLRRVSDLPQALPVDPLAEQIFAAVSEAMVPPGGPFEEGAGSMVSSAEVEAFVSGAGPSAPRALRMALRVFDVAPYFMPPLRLRRFSQLPLTDRVQILEAWEHSRFIPRRQAMHLLKLLIMTHVYSRPEIAARLGYPHPLERVPRTQHQAA